MAGQAIVLVTALAALSQTGDATRATAARVESVPSVSRFAAGEACAIFNDQAEFETAMEQGGMGMVGIETFWEGMLFDSTVVFDDPLCGGIPALPDGFPYPNGLDVLNLCVQSNFEHDPVAPNPRGVGGLVGASVGVLGLSSDIVLAFEFLDSLDLMFTEPNPTAIGFKPISLLGGDVVEVRVYDTSNTLLASATSPADAPGQNFWGVLCPDAIGRINIFDTGNGAEGGDNIGMWLIPVCGDEQCVAETCETCPEDCVACLNDDCEDAIEIFDGDTEFSTIGATTDGASHPQCHYGASYQDIWYDYTATCTGALTVSTCGTADYDTDLAVYDGCEMPCPPGDEHVLDCGEGTGGCWHNTTELIVTAAEGSCYKVRVGGRYDGDQGSGTLNLTCTPNDLGDLVIFTEPAEFEAFAEGQGAILTGIETFEESILPPDAGAVANDPLEPGVPNQPDTAYPFPNGLEGVDNMIYQSNVDGGNPDDPHPEEPDSSFALSVHSVGAMGATSDVVVSYGLGDSTDMIFTQDGVSAVGFDTVSMLFGEVTVRIRAYDRDNVLLGLAFAPTDRAGSHFFGVWSPVGIGRINVWDPLGGFEGTDNIQIWVSVDLLCGDCPTDVDGSGDTGAADLAVLLGSWGPCAPGHECACLDADDDGTIGAADLAALLGAWGPCP